MSSEKNFEPQITYPPFGGRVRDARENFRKVDGRKLSSTELGARIGLSNVAISRGETGERNFSKQTAFDLAHELGTDFGEPEIHNHLTEWLKRMSKIWGNGGGDNDNDSPDNLPPMPPPASTGLPVHARIGVSGGIKEGESEDFNAVLDETRAQRKERNATKKKKPPTKRKRKK